MFPGALLLGCSLISRQHGPDFSPEKTWASLATNIREIQAHNAANLSFEENHRFAYNMVLYKHGDMLYRGVMKLVNENLEQLAKDDLFPAFPSGASSDPMEKSQEGEMLLKALKRTWDDHTGNMQKLGQVLKYMVRTCNLLISLFMTFSKAILLKDRVYTKSAEVPETWEAGLKAFLQNIIRSPIKDHVITAVLNQIEVERDGYVINRSAVKGCVDVLLSLQTDGGATVYKHLLEPAVLKESQSYYEREGRRAVEECDAPGFLKKVRCLACLASSPLLIFCTGGGAL